MVKGKYKAEILEENSDIIYHSAMMLLPLCPASLTHKNPQGCKKIHGMCPLGCKD